MNVALLAATTSSSCLGNNCASYGPALAVDGYLAQAPGGSASTGFFHTNSATPGEFFLIDLGAPYILSRLVFYNRVDCCNFRSVGTQLQLLDEGFGQLAAFNLTNSTAPQVYTVPYQFCPTPSTSVSASVTTSASRSGSLSVSPSLSGSRTPSPSFTGTQTPTISLTSTGSLTVGASASGTDTRTQSGTASNTPSATVTATLSATASSTQTRVSASGTPAGTGSNTVGVSASFTAQVTPSLSTGATPTGTGTATATFTATSSSSATESASAASTASLSTGASASTTASNSPSGSIQLTPTQTMTASLTRGASASRSSAPSLSGTASSLPTASVTATASLASATATASSSPSSTAAVGAAIAAAAAAAASPASIVPVIGGIAGAFILLGVAGALLMRRRRRAWKERTRAAIERASDARVNAAVLAIAGANPMMSAAKRGVSDKLVALGPSASLRQRELAERRMALLAEVSAMEAEEAALGDDFAGGKAAAARGTPAATVLAARGDGAAAGERVAFSERRMRLPALELAEEASAADAAPAEQAAEAEAGEAAVLEPALPEGWVEAWSNSQQRPYWRNSATGVSSWTRPA